MLDNWSPGFTALRVIVYLCLLDSLGLEGCYNLESLIHIGYFADGVLEPSYFHELLHPGRHHFLKNTEEAFFGHTRWKLAKHQAHIAR